MRAMVRSTLTSRDGPTIVSEHGWADARWEASVCRKLHLALSVTFYEDSRTAQLELVEMLVDGSSEIRDIERCEWSSVPSVAFELLRQWHSETTAA